MHPLWFVSVVLYYLYSNNHIMKSAVSACKHYCYKVKKKTFNVIVIPKQFSRSSHIYTKTNQQQQSMYTQKQRQKARVTGSSSRMIEVCACLSSELFRVAALSEHAPDEVSQGVERAVITGRLEGRSNRQTALRGVRHTRRACLHVSGPSYSHRLGPCWQTDISQGPLSFTLCVLFPPFFLWFSPSSERAVGSEGGSTTDRFT